LVKLPAPSPNPRYGELCAILAAHPEWLSPWSGHFFRFQTIQFPAGRNILSGTGARHRGGRWNPPGLAALYGSTTDTAALEEAKANDRYYGLETKTPRLVVAIEAKMGKMLDLTSPGIRRQLGITLAELSGEDWRKLLQSGQESLSQALGRAAASTGASGLLVRSTAVHQAHNVILFPPLGGSDRLNIIEGDALARLTVGKKP
jgi:RES domain-containing protein